MVQLILHVFIKLMCRLLEVNNRLYKQSSVSQMTMIFDKRDAKHIFRFSGSITTWFIIMKKVAPFISKIEHSSR